MQRKHSILYPVVGAALLLLSCSEKQVPSSITTVSLEDYRETLDAKEIFRRSDYYNMSDWIVPDEKGNLKIQLGKESGVRNLWMRNDEPLGFSMQGGAEKTVLLAPSLANETSSARFTMQLESGKDLKSQWMEATLLFRLFADESCAGKPINESGCISLKDLVVKY